MITVDRLKTILRINHSELDAELNETICECKGDLEMAGIKVDTAELRDSTEFAAAAVLFCRARFESDPAKGEIYMKRYDALKASMSMSSKFNSEVRDA